MKTKTFFCLLTLVLLVLSCSTSDKHQSGKPYDILDKEVYNKIQQNTNLLMTFRKEHLLF